MKDLNITTKKQKDGTWDAECVELRIIYSGAPSKEWAKRLVKHQIKDLGIEIDRIKE